MSKTINIGKVSLTPKGRWSADISYEHLDTVCHNGCFWIARDASVGEEPSEENGHWIIALDNSSSGPGGGEDGELVVNIEDLTFSKTTNLYDIENDEFLLPNTIIDGGINSQMDGVCSTGYIEIKGGQPYCISSMNERKAAIVIVQYDDSKGYISTLEYSENDAYVLTDEAAKYIRFSFYTKDKKSITLENRYYPKFVGVERKHYIPKEYVLEEPCPFAFLPDRIYVGVGRRIEIYNANVCLFAENYHFKWSCDVGKSYERKFSVEGSFDNLGEYNLTLEIHNKTGEIVYAKTAVLEIAIGPPDIPKNICALGDVYTAGKYWLDEVVNITDSQIDFVGTRQSSSGMCHEGVSGWNSSTFVYSSGAKDLDSNKSVSNTFYDGQGFSWDGYALNTSADGVQLFFGERELLNGSAETLSNNLCTMIESIRNSTNIPIFVVLPPFWGSQDGMARQNPGGAGLDFSGKSKYECDKIILSAAETISKRITERNYRNVYIVPLYCCFDSQNNMETEEVYVNPRSSKKETIHKGAVTPSTSGYEQMADVFFSAYCAAFGMG